MVKVSFMISIIWYSSCCVGYETAKGLRHAKLTDEHKAQRDAKRREAYAMKKMGAVHQRCVSSLLMLVMSRLPKNLNTHNLFT